MRFSSYLTTGLAAIGLLTVTVSATTYTWDGSSNQAWATGANWDLGSAPGGADTAVIPDKDTTPNDPLISTSVTVAVLHVDDDGEIELGNSGALTVTDITVDDLAGFVMSGNATADVTGTLTTDGLFAMSGTAVLTADNLSILNGGEFEVGSSTADAEIQDASGLSVATGGLLDVFGVFEVSGGGTHLLSGTGALQLSQASATFRVSASATFDYSGSPGTILGLNNSSIVDIPTGVVFTSKVVIAGRMQINGAGSGTLNNSMIVSASTGGTIALGSSLNLADIDGAVWEANGTNSILEFNKMHTGNSALKGDISLSSSGKVDLNASIALEAPGAGVAFFSWSGGTLEVTGTFSYENYSGPCTNPDASGPPYSVGSGTYGPC